MTGPKNAAAPGTETEGKRNDQQAKRIKDNPTARPKRLSLDYASAISCPLACTADRRSFPWRCAPLSVRDGAQ